MKEDRENSHGLPSSCLFFLFHDHHGGSVRPTALPPPSLKKKAKPRKNKATGYRAGCPSNPISVVHSSSRLSTVFLQFDANAGFVGTEAHAKVVGHTLNGEVEHTDVPDEDDGENYPPWRWSQEKKRRKQKKRRYPNRKDTTWERFSVVVVFLLLRFVLSSLFLHAWPPRVETFSWRWWMVVSAPSCAIPIV